MRKQNRGHICLPTVALLCSTALLSSCATSDRAGSASEETLIHAAALPPDRLITTARPGATLESWPVYLGTPAGPDCTILRNTGYVSCFSEETGTPLWVHYVASDQRPHDPDPDRPRFITDTRVAHQVTHDDYTNTGYDRGHMAPNSPIARRYGVDAQYETFLLTNAVPQVPGLNQRGWQCVEELIDTDWSVQLLGVAVFVGPIFEGECREIQGGVRIPSHCYMVIVDWDEDSGEVIALGIIMEQRRINEEPLSRFVVTVDEIEERTGIDFLSQLPDAVENAVESASADARWDVSQTLHPSYPGAARPIVSAPCN